MSASETPPFATEIVKLLGLPPAVTLGSAKLFATESCTSSTIATVSVPEAVSSSDEASASLPTDGSLSVVEATW